MKQSRSFKLFVFAVLIVTGCTKKENPDKKVGVVSKQDVIQKISLNGTLRGLRQTQIQAGYPGYVGKIYVSVGEIVKEGQPLVRVTQTINQPLNEVFPIRAPFGGTVTQILKREGEFVAQATGGSSENTNGILVLNDLKQIWIDATVPEVDVAKISIGLEAQIRANALPGKTYKGRVETLSLSPKQSSDRWDRGRVEYPLEIRVLNPDADLKPGMTVVADVISAKAENVFAIRHEFLHKDNEGYYLLDTKDTKHRIETGLSNEEVIEIKKGAEVGLKVQMLDFSKL